MQITANGITFNTQVEGPEKAPWLIFSNSLATNLTMWDDQAVHFARSFRVVRYDQRGHGKTEAPAGRYPFDTLLADAVALMDALAIKRAHFCGLSLGGATAMGLAERHPDRFDRIVVCDSPCASSPASAAQWEERIVIAQKDGMTALADSTLARWFPPEIRGANPPYIAKVREMILTTPVNGFIGCSAALADHDYRSAAGTVTKPVLFLAGEKDGTNAASMRELQTKTPGSRYVELSGGGHISNMDRPAEFTKAMADFLAA
jgi:3-oxoadipate enol-lactonase